jgi:hypothetical protein
MAGLGQSTSRVTFCMKSSSHVGTVAFSGSSCQARALCALIAERIHCAEDEIDLFTSGGVKIGPDDPVAASSFVEVARRALELDPKKRPPPRPRPKAGGTGGEMVAVDHIAATSEEERIAMLQHNVGSHTGASERFGRPQFRRQNTETIDSRKPPPPGYVCHGCGRSGHYIEHCPNGRIGERPKALSAPIGIPESMLEECPPDYDGPKYVTRDGKLVRRRVDKQSFVAMDALEGNAVPLVDIPGHLKCPVCLHLVVDAMSLPCCSRAVCFSCLNQSVSVASEKFPDDPPTCPVCQTTLIVDDVEISEELRAEAASLKAEGARKRARE